MDLSNLNLNDVDIKEGFDVLPSGVYELRVTKVEQKMPKNKPAGEAYPYLNWTFEVINEEEYKNQKIFHMTSLSPRALGMPQGLKALWVALDLPLDNVNKEDALGLTLTADVGQEIYQKPRPDGSHQEITKNIIDRFHYA